MKKTYLTLVLSFLVLITLALPASAQEITAMHGFFDSLDTGLMYGPPLPPSIPAPAVAAVTPDKTLLKNVVDNSVPDTLTYKVKSGDSLSFIAACFNTQVDVLMQINNLTNPHLLKVDQELKIPNLEKKLITPDLKIKQVISADLTAYTAGPESTGKSPGDPGYGITASGTYVHDNQTIAVDPRKIPIGTKVYIEGIGVRVAEDTGGAIQGNRIDVYMSNLAAAVQFGYKRNVKVYILDQTSVSNA